MTTPDQSHKDTLAHRVIDRITAEHLQPRPRWAFLFENYFFWGLGAAAVLLGALAVSAIIFEVQNADWQYAFITHSGALSFALDVAPLLWLGALGLFIGIGYLNVRRTQHGYRYPLAVIAIGAVLASVALGSALYEQGIGEIVEESTSHTPFFSTIETKQHAWWIAPAHGLLGGSVIESAPDASSFELRDFNGTVWHIDASDLAPHDLAAVVRGGVVRVVGVPMTATSSAFHACFVFPWEIYGGRKGGPLPLPVVLVGSTTRSRAQSDACTRTQPYAQLRSLDDTDGF